MEERYLLRWQESAYVKWTIPAALGAAWSYRLSLGGEMIWYVECIIGMSLLLLAISLYLKGRSNAHAYWDNSRGVLGLVWTHSVEVCAGRLFDKVPQGIDLSHSASKVLGAMSEHFDDEPGGTLEFVMCRPLKEGPTRVGFVVKRSGVRTQNTKNRLDILADDIEETVQILESSMRAAYPHTRVREADRRDMLLITSGGVDTIARTA